ncbi:hypothetical protein AHAS_Ahas03G0252600 [Arachis hypogaea]
MAEWRREGVGSAKERVGEAVGRVESLLVVEIMKGADACDDKGRRRRKLEEKVSSF